MRKKRKKKIQFFAGKEKYNTPKQEKLGKKGLLHMSVNHPKCKNINHDKLKNDLIKIGY